ncbi:VanZ family protein [Bacillus spongiae]|uniref:VanZ family protein n=1 Tax=Bacillus spongiae TaxID=2683610 RepID=A0ABU8HBX5_9BACI
MVHVKTPFSRAIVFALFLSYLSFLLYLLYFSEYRSYVGSLEERSVNLLPLNTISDYIVTFERFHFRILTDNFFGNIIAFMPFGFLVPILWTKLQKLRSVALLSAFFSLTIEVVQYITKLGACDIDDIILNTAGGIVGYLGYKFILGLNQIVKTV